MHFGLPVVLVGRDGSGPVRMGQEGCFGGVWSAPGPFWVAAGWISPKSPAKNRDPQFIDGQKRHPQFMGSWVTPKLSMPGTSEPNSRPNIKGSRDPSSVPDSW
jgi:hypothetical protein